MKTSLNEDELNHYCLEHAGEELSAEALEHLRQNPVLKAEVDRLAAVGRIIALTRYTVPDPAASRRCAMAVQARIEQARNTTWLARVKEWWMLDAPPVAGWAYGSAVAALLVAGLVFYPDRAAETPALITAVETAEPIALATLEPVPAKNEMADLALFALAGQEQDEPPALPVLADFDKPLIFLRAPGEVPPPARGRMTFGGDSSVPVSFEY